MARSQFNKDSIANTIIVTLLLCVVCSVFVSTAAVFLKEKQLENKQLDMQKNILMAAGLITDATISSDEISQLFQKAKVKLVELETGKYEANIDSATYDQRKAAKNPALSKRLLAKHDIASIKRQANYAKIYLFEKDGRLDRIVLPIHGYGLWSTLYGFIALESDLKTVVGIGFYEHAETPGLGGEVDNPRWKNQWKRKEVYDETGNVAIELVKGSVDLSKPDAVHQVDALAGASLTSRGVQNLLNFWLGSQGFGPFLTRLREEM